MTWFKVRIAFLVSVLSGLLAYLSILAFEQSDRTIDAWQTLANILFLAAGLLFILGCFMPLGATLIKAASGEEGFNQLKEYTPLLGFFAIKSDRDHRDNE